MVKLASTVNVSDETSRPYKEMKDKSVYKYITFKFQDNTYTDIVIDQIGDKDATYADFCDALRGDGPAQCRYGVVDFSYFLETRKLNRNKLLFFTWAPDTGSVKDKMCYAASKGALKKAFETGISKDIQASDESDINEADIIEMLKKMDKN